MASDGVKTGVVPASYIRILGTRKKLTSVPTQSAATSESESPSNPIQSALSPDTKSAEET